jgi:aryl-phospho-beta-D-glucosidase BglC (GH1 family)
MFSIKPFNALVTLFLFVNICCSLSVRSQGFLHTKGKDIVNEKGEKVLLRGIGLGGWMLQEGYMLRFQGEGMQHRIREKFKSVVGEEKVAKFYDAWLKNHMQKADVDLLKKWGFNSIRLPMHYALYTLPIEQEPVKGKDTWLQKGFALTDSLLSWCKKNKMYLILDMHAAPGGQGNDLNISDRDPSKPSLWESEANQRKMVALWHKLADRYKDEPWIGGYDIINEPNWGFSDLANDKNGLKEQKNEPLRKLLQAITTAIREVDQKHIVIIEGNGWGNNYNGIFPLWDKNMVLSFHKYWNKNDQGSIQHFLDLRDKYNVPLWLGETGENSNVWFTEMVRLVESNGIGWALWPLKKLGFNNPLQIKEPKGYQKLLDYFNGKGEKPSEEEAYKTLMQLAENTKAQNCIVHPDVMDALFRQPFSTETKPFKPNLIGKKATIQAVDYDLGRVDFAYFDNDTADYHISAPSNRNFGNKGRVYRNDGVDIGRTDSASVFYVSNMESGEWLQYTLQVQKAGTYTINLSVKGEGEVRVDVNGSSFSKAVPSANGEQRLWENIRFQQVFLQKGKNSLRIQAVKGGFDLKEIGFSKE